MTNHAIGTQAEVKASNPAAVMNCDDLAFAIGLVAKVIERRNMIPVLSNALIKAGSDGAVVCGTDQDMELSVTVPGAVDSRFAITLPAHRLSDVLKAVGKGGDLIMEHAPVHFTPWAEGNSEDERRKRLKTSMNPTYAEQATLKSGRTEYSINGVSWENYPDTDGFINPREFRIDGAGNELPVDHWNYSMPWRDFIAALDKVRGAISTDELRYYLNGAYLHLARSPGGAELRVVSTDGHRLYMKQLAAIDIPATLPGLIIPRKTIDMLIWLHGQMKKAKRLPDRVAIDCDAGRIRFDIGGIVLASKCIDLTFPDYERVIPRHNDKIAEFGCKDLADAIGRVTVMSDAKGRALKMAFSGESTVLSVSDADAGMASTVIEGTCQMIADRDPVAAFEAGYNSRYLLDAIALVDGDFIQFKIQDAGSPALILDPSDPGFTGVVMPMRV